MAATDETSPSGSMSTTSYETALCALPPQHKCQDIENLRSLYDKSYGKWPPHINLIYPFVAPEHLSRAKSQIESALQDNIDIDQERRVTLNAAGHFAHRSNNTIFLCEGEGVSKGTLQSLRSTALRALGQEPSSCNFHLTIGQSEDETDSARDFLLSKANLVPSLSFEVESLAILVRERSFTPGDATSRMRLWGCIELLRSQKDTAHFLREFWLGSERFKIENLELEDEESDSGDQATSSVTLRGVQPGTTFQFNAATRQWVASELHVYEQEAPATVSLSSYNVLIDSEYPPARDRDALLVNTLLLRSAVADIVVLQEVSDDFLSYLLADKSVRQLYPFTSHGPPDQSDIGPLPSLRNIVILSKWHFAWEYVPFHRRHKGALVAKFPSIVRDGDEAVSFVVAGVHLTCGLTDGSVAAKKVQVQNLTRHLSRNYPGNPWIIAGDFNLTTSKYTIDEAVKAKAISQQTVRTLESIESMLSEASLLDTWAVSKVEGTEETGFPEAEDLFEGEEGATFNPMENVLAAATSGTSNNRPQRYDRVLVRSQGVFTVHRFNQFGLPGTTNGISQVPSDHSGIRASFRVQTDIQKDPSGGLETLNRTAIKHIHASGALSNSHDLSAALSRRQVFPSAEEEKQWKDAFALIKKVILGASEDEEDSSIADIPMVIVPVGSYALGVWTPSSDIDCLCIGSISSKTFFKLARQRILRAESLGVRLLRKVEANTGTMLELSVNGVNMDLQYCPAAGVVQRWAEFPHLQPSDPIFNLPILSLRKLKPIRDLTYIQRTLPSPASFRLAYHFIRLWAVQRGIYTAKFGYLGGIHITIMLSCVCKRLVHDIGSISAGDLIVSFFHHYSRFDWKNGMVFDPFFHKRPRYQRSVREPMVILGYHAPNSNIAHTATGPGLDIIVKELKRANERLAMPGMTWDRFFDDRENVDSVKDFLTSHESYAKIDIQYWGRALSRGKGLVGWVESRGINLVVDIHKSLPHLSVRIWPARFAEKQTNASDSYYHGCYLIGLSRDGDGSAPTSDERTHAKQTIQKAFDRFLTQVQADERYYDSNSCWIGVSLAKPADVIDLRLDDREWGDYVAEPDADSDDEEDLDELDNEPADIQPAKKSQPKPLASTTGSAAVSARKLRPASEVLNRLRWDPNLDPSEYVVGYEDRFVGAKETGLERWKTEQTDEEFIPQHRILYFKKKGGEIVWERRTRVDRIFGSGIGGGEGSA